jgi:hypothetical protein
MAIERAGDKIPAAESGASDAAMDLGHIPDSRISPRRGPTENADIAPLGATSPQDGAHERGLAGTVRTQYADELAGGDIDRNTGEDGMTVEGQR